MINKITEYFNNKSSEKLERTLKATVQIKEFEGCLWLTYMGNLICPMNMFKDAPIDVVNSIREHKLKALKTKE